MLKNNLKLITLSLFLFSIVLCPVEYKKAEASTAHVEKNFTQTSYTNFVSSDGRNIVGVRGGTRSINISTTSGATFTPISQLGTSTWSDMGISITGSDDFTKLWLKTNTNIWYSIDSGLTWATSTSVNSIPHTQWKDMWSSASGVNLFLTNNTAPYLYYSTTSGATWATSSIPSGYWNYLTMSASSTKISISNGVNKFYVSTTSGATWVDRSATFPTVVGTLMGFKYSPDGSHLFWADDADSKIYTSINDGLSWTYYDIPGVTAGWGKIASSYDGMKVFAGRTPDAGNWFLYSSIDGGTAFVRSSDSNVFGTNATFDSTPGRLFVSYDGLTITSLDHSGTISFTTPIISNNSLSAGVSTSTISFTTDKSATSSVSYGLAPSIYTDTVSTSTASTTSSFNITNLLPCTTYNYKYDVMDIYSNPATSPNYSFKTSGCIANTTYIQSTSTAISNLGTLSLGNLHLTIPSGFSATTTSAQFEATELATTTVISTLGKPARYNLFNSLYQLQAMPTATSTLTTFTNPLFITLTYNPATLGVTDPSTLTIFSTDGSVWSPLSSCVVDTGLHTVTCPTTHFSTFGIFGLTIPSVITNTAVSLSGLQATISWNTDKGATTGLNYGTDSSVTTSTTTDASFASTSHYVILPNLSYSTTYYYQIVSTDSDSNTSTTSVMSFTTSADPSIVVSSGGGGGGGYYPPALLATLVSSSTTSNNIGCASGNLFSTVTGQACGITTSSTKYDFTKDLRLGMRNNDVLQLQKFLNNNGFAIAKTGVGSKGKETTYFGPATKAALIKFQKANKVPGTGFFGKMTRGVVGR